MKTTGLIELARAQGQIAADEEAATVREMTLNVGARKDLRGLDGFPALELLTVFADKAISLRGIEPLVALRGLKLGVPSVKDLEALGALPLRHLTVGAARQASLAGLGSRTLLDLTAMGMGLKSLEGLDLPGLRRLDVSMNKIADLGPLATLPAVRYLDLRGNPASDLAPLSSLTGLRALSLHGMRRVKDLGPLAHLRALTRLTLTGVRAKDRSAIAGLSASVVDVDGPGGEGAGWPALPWDEAVVRAGLAAEDERGQLALVEYGGLGVDGLAGVGALSGLRELRAMASEASGVEQLPSLLHLVLDPTEGGPERADLAAIGRAVGLRRLNLRHPLAGAAALPPNPSVRHLFLTAPRERALSLAGIERFPQLLTLVVGGRTAPDLAPLEALPALRVLSLQVPEAQDEVEAWKKRLDARAAP